MKKIAIFVSLILCLSSASCTDNPDKPGNTVSGTTANTPESTTAEVITTVERTTPEITTEATTEKESPASEGLYQITYTAVTSNNINDLSDRKEITDLAISIEIPEYMVNASDLENSPTYFRFDEDIVEYIPALEIGPTVFAVDDEFVLDETVHLKASAGGMSSPTIDGYDISEGKTTGGYDYVIYETADETNFDAQVYIRLTNEYVLKLKYRDTVDNYANLKKSFYSIDVEKS